MLNRLAIFLFVMVLIVPVTVCADVVPNSEPSVPLMKAALKSYVNYEICWAGGGLQAGTPYRVGKTVTLTLSINKNERKFYFWGDELQYAAELNQPPLADLYYGVYSKNLAVITGSDIANTTAANVMKWLMQRKDRYFSGQITKVDFTIPSDCVMNFPPSKEKTEMVDAIVKTMASFVEQVNREEQFEYPTPLHVVIANFDVNYPRTFVYIEETNEVYALALHDITNYFGDTFLKEGYPFNLVNYFDKNSPFVKKIMRYGINKTINVPGTQSREKGDATLFSHELLNLAYAKEGASYLPAGTTSRYPTW